MAIESKKVTKKTWRYQTLADQLRQQIRQGVLRPGDKLPTFGEMRERFDAAPHTVDRMYALLEDEGLVFRKERQGIFVASPEEQKKTGVLGLMGIKQARRDDPYYMPLISGIHDAAFQAGLEILLLRSEGPIQWEKIDGLLVVGHFWEDDRKRIPPGMMCVSLLYPVDEVSCVVADDLEGGEKATRYLIEQGHRRIACLTRFNHPLTALRVAGYEKALRQAGITQEAGWLHELDMTVYPEDDFREWGYRNMKRWLETDWNDSGCTALVAQNDWVAAGALTAFLDAGIRVPEDVSVIGFDNLMICDYMTPHLSSVEVPLYDIGKTGVELLLRKMNKEEVGRIKVTLPVQLRIRNSIGPGPK